MLKARRLVFGMDPMGGYGDVFGKLQQSQQPDVAYGTPKQRSPYERMEVGLQGLGMAGIPGVSDVAGLAGDAMMFSRDPESRTPMNFGLSALGLLPFVPGITAFHGSPHRINNISEDAPLGKFDLSKIGTGEGAQAYGHGIYLAENPGVAKSYQVIGDGNDLVVRRGGKEIARGAEIDDDLLEVSGLLERGADTAGEFKHNTAYYAKLKADSKFVPGPRLEKLKQMIDEYADATFSYEKNPGHFYTVDLPDEHIANMLDWDAPLSEQPEAVRKAIKQLPSETRQLFESADYAGNQKPMSEAYMALAEYFGRGDSNAGKAIASDELLQLGIPGIRYLDGNSRTAGEGTRNFVVFDPEIAKILKRE